MKRLKIINILWVIALALSTLAGCSKPKTIPDEKLSDIFADMYILNAYSNNTSLNFDSVDIYEPLLNRHGYTTEDFKHTLGDYTKRKSARMSRVVDRAIEKLDVRYDDLSAEIRVLDMIDSMAIAISRDTVFTDSLIRVTKVEDTTKLRILIPVEPKGTYDIAYYYKQDSLDKNTNLLNTHTIINHTGHSVKNTSTRIRNNNRTRYTTTLDAIPTGRELRLIFGNYPDAEAKLKNEKDRNGRPKNGKLQRVDFTVDSLIVIYNPPIEEAREKLLRSHFDYRLMVFDKEYYEYYDMPADSSALHIQPPLLPSPRDSIVQ